MGVPLEKRDGFRSDPRHALIEALRELRESHGLFGCVLISFTADRAGVNSTGLTPEFGAAMQELGDKILTAIDDGQFDPKDLTAH